MCGKPTINNEAWRAPELQDGDVLVRDEPGRCGGLDHHSHNFRLVKHSSSFFLLVRHGGGDERIRLFPHRDLGNIIGAMDSTPAYWMLATIYDAYRDGKADGYAKEHHLWQEAAAEKRIKTRKQPSRGVIKVWIEPKATLAGL
jgi:hypothetical protein